MNGMVGMGDSYNAQCNLCCPFNRNPVQGLVPVMGMHHAIAIMLLAMVGVACHHA
jgi:hypothetical protein